MVAWITHSHRFLDRLLWRFPVHIQPLSLLLGGKRMLKLIAGLRRFRGRVIYDLPALQGHETALEAAAAIGNVVLVLRSGWSRRADTRQLVELLQRRHINILGTWVIDVPDHYQENNQPVARNTASGNTTYEAIVQDRKDNCPAGRFADPKECGDLIAFLCSAQAGFMSGQNIVNDGGVYQGLF